MNNILKHPEIDYEFNKETGQYRKVGSEIWKNGQVTNRGYNVLTYWDHKDKKYKTRTIQILMIETFNIPITKSQYVKHLDDNQTNNAISNLEVRNKSEYLKNRNNETFKHSNKQAKPIQCYDNSTGETLNFKSGYECAKHINCSAGSVALACNENTENKTLNKRFIVKYKKQI